MFAEQHHPLFLRKISERLGRPIIRGLDAYPLFIRYFNNLSQGIEKNEALRKFRNELEVNLRSYTQEGIGDRDIMEYGTKVVRDKNGTISFVDYRGVDTLGYQREQNRITYKDHPDVIAYFDKELGTWENLWRTAIYSLEDLIGEPNPDIILPRLHEAGFRHLRVNETIPELCEVSVALTSLFPELANDKFIELYEHPQKYVLASPRHRLHHNGETSIARLVRFVYVPKLNTFAFLERGLFTAYTNDEITTFFTLDGKDKPHFSSPEEILAHVAFLTQEFATQAPHAVFNHIINKLRSFPEIPVGNNVIREKPRTFTTQIEYVEQILAFEEHALIEHPELEKTLKQRLQHILEPIEHSLLRGNELNVKAQVENYIRIFSNLPTAQNPEAAREKFRLGVLASYPDFATRVGSILDCSTGSLLGGLRKAGGLGGLESVMGNNAFTALQHLEGKSISNRAEFESLARCLGKDPSKFLNWGVCQCEHCASKGLENFLGPCGWCLACEVKDDLGIMGALPDLSDNSNALSPLHESEETYDRTEHKRKTSLTTVVASVANPNLLRAV